MFDLAIAQDHPLIHEIKATRRQPIEIIEDEMSAKLGLKCGVGVWTPNGGSE
jgi:hypothetical protein